MPAIANVTVKAANGTTDVIFVATNPSSGDGVPALWRVDAEGINAAVRPWASMSSKWNAQKTARQVEIFHAHPFSFTDSTTGLVQSKDRAFARTFITLPVGITETILAEFAARNGNLLASTLFKDCIKLGYAPT